MAPQMVLPGFYFDPEKNRYFPIKGPIPGTKRSASASLDSVSDQKDHDHTSITGRRTRLRASELLQLRELNGRNVTSGNLRYDFIQDYQKFKASNPLVWIYHRTANAAGTGVEQLHGVVQTPTGLERSSLLVAGSMSGCARIYVVGEAGRHLDNGDEYMPKTVWPQNNHEGINTNIARIWSSTGLSTLLASNISSVRPLCKWPPDSLDDVAPSKHLLLQRRIRTISTTNFTIWTADCSSNGRNAAIGTNVGAALVDIETGKMSSHRLKSDVFSLQFDQSGNIIFCGLRKGAILPVDVRVRHFRSLRSYAGYRSMSNKVQEDSNSSSMPSAVCSLAALKSDEKYLLGSSMDGCIQLFDCRLLQRPVQSYMGHVNSHSHLQLGVDPSESFFMSGGEDHFLRIWSIKTCELLFAKNFSNAALNSICWSQTGNISKEMQRSSEETVWYHESGWELDQSWRAWLGSDKGLFYMHGT
ncbi:putative transcription factor WD40-like family [Dioscorea sansibarensis]